MLIPRGFLADLGFSITRHDTLFLQQICQELNLPFAKTRNKILGRGENVEIEFTNDLSEGNTQCEFWLLHSEAKAYKQCPARQMLGCSGCELHNVYNTFESTKGLCVKKSALLECPELEWIYNEQAQEYLLYHPISKKLFTKDLIPKAGVLYYDPKMEGYLLIEIDSAGLYLWNKRHAHAQKIENAANSKVS